MLLLQMTHVHHMLWGCHAWHSVHAQHGSITNTILLCFSHTQGDILTAEPKACSVCIARPKVTEHSRWHLTAFFPTVCSITPVTAELTGVKCVACSNKCRTSLSTPTMAQPRSLCMKQTLSPAMSTPPPSPPTPPSRCRTPTPLPSAQATPLLSTSLTLPSR